jgi:diguanylate cyclase (GGDEF)-like protein
MEDVTDAKASLERLNTPATTDSLTGLTNRTLFHDRLTQAIAVAGREGTHQVVMMLMDLDHFKEINDTLGHPAGDEVLIEVARRLQQVPRNTDTLARLGGDEFGLLLPQVSDGHRTAEKIAKQIQQAFVAPYLSEDNELFLGASIGIAIYPEHGDDVATLMSRADVAMYGTKNTESGYMFYDSGLDPYAQHHLQLSGDLRHALERNELVLHYQPKIDLRSGSVMGAEALIRWQHPVQGMISPDNFIPLAERTGLIRPITDWVIDTAVKQNVAWRAAGYDLQIAVNVSARSFQNTKLVDHIKHVLKNQNMQAMSLEIEITENSLMTDIINITKMLKQISDLGVTIAIDDFGTGYSSLAYLKTMPLHTLKIDKSFVIDMSSDENDAVIVRSTIDLAHNLGLGVVAEGIENDETLAMLIELGCDGAQGYHFSKPQPSDIFLAWLQQGSMPSGI